MADKKKPRVLAIVGPTASGKSELAVRLAREIGGEIISADSRQVYKGLDVGTGKITKEEMQGIPHHLLDVADPTERFSAADYKKLAESSLRYIVVNKRLPIIVGGTGFYIYAMAEIGKFPEVPPNPELREELESKSTEELFKQLQERDPRRAESIDRSNKVRLVRALEIVEELGAVPQPEGTDSPYEFVYIGLLPSDLDKRIRERLERRMDGMIAEAKKLHSEGLSYKRMRELGLEYKYLAMHLQGELSIEEMQEKLCTAIRQYARRQMTWFKRNTEIKWFEPGEYGQIGKYLTNKL